jgi:tRNA-5-methyluridine54 2-sulfurtransferase
MPRKVKPLIRLTEREMAAYCIVRGIDYQVEECPMAAGNRHLEYKAALNSIELASPGSKFAFYDGFQRRMAPLLDGVWTAERDELNGCERCGAPTSTEGLCAFCRLTDTATRPQQVTLGQARRGRQAPA